MNSFNEETLQKSANSKLRKQPKRNAVRVSMTADKVIASLLEKSNADEDSFVTLERSILNSCKKNKETLFEKDSKQMSETPRRDTYIVDTPATNSQLSMQLATNKSLVMASASPELKQSNDHSLNVTLTRGSEKKNRKSKRKVSFVTPLRRSTRISIATPQYNSVKGRPKTPIPSRLSSATKHLPVGDQENDSFACNLNLDISGTSDTKKTSVGKVKRPSTPMPLSKQKRRSFRSSGESRTSYKQCLDSSPKVVLHRLKEEDLKEISSKLTATPNAEPYVKQTKAETPCATQSKVKVLPISIKKVTPLAPGFKKIVTPFSTPNKPKSISSTHRQQEKMILPQSSSKTNALTPGFKKIVTPFSSSTKATPRSLRKLALTPGLTSSVTRKSPRSNIKLAVTPSSVKKTPNFNKMHQRAFEKMESLSDYQQRKKLTFLKKQDEQKKFVNVSKPNASKQKKASLELKKTLKGFGGIPFIPSAATTQPIKSNQKLRSEMKAASLHQSKDVKGKSLAKKAKTDNVKAIKSVPKENTPLKRKYKFDLKASLSRKLSYKPHAGPLKPLNEVNMNKTLDTLPTVQKAETKNVVITKARTQAREVLRGVRKNKRFLLQMNNRNLNISMQ